MARRLLMFLMLVVIALIIALEFIIWVRIKTQPSLAIGWSYPKLRVYVINSCAPEKSVERNYGSRFWVRPR